MVKVLLLAALLTSVAIADSHVMRVPQALDPLKGAHTSASVERHLRSNAAVAKSGQTEERLDISPFLTMLQERLQPIISKAEESSMWFAEPSISFRDLKLDQKEFNELFASRQFFQWVDIVLSQHRSSEEEAFLKMYSVLSSRCGGDDALDKLLVSQLDTSVNSPVVSELAKILLHVQIAKWVTREEISAEEIFTLLNLQSAKDKLFESPALSLWEDFVFTYHWNIPEKERYAVMYSVLSRHYNDDDALDQLLAAQLSIGEKNNKWFTFAKTLLQGQFEKWVKGGKDAQQILTHLNLHKKTYDPLYSPVFKLWVDYVVYWDGSDNALRPIFSALTYFYKRDKAGHYAKIMVKYSNGEKSRPAGDTRAG